MEVERISRSDLRGQINPWRDELKALLVLGFPIGLTQLVQFSINTIDVLMISPLGTEYLAASSIGLVIFYATYLVGSALALSISPMVSQALGVDKNDFKDVRRSVRMGLWAVGFLFPFVCCILVYANEIALSFKQPESLATLAGPYVLALVPGWPFMVGVLVLRNFLAALGKTKAPFITIAITSLVNVLFNYLLIYGSWGFPKLDLVGAGLASSISHLIGFSLLAGYVHWEEHSRKFHIFTRFFSPDWERLKEIVILAWPIVVTMAFESMLFNAGVFLMGRIGIEEVAAYQVTLNIVTLAFMLPYGFSIAGATRVGLAKGAGDHLGVIRASVITIGVCWAHTLIFAVPAFVAPDWVAGLYLDLSDPKNTAAISLVILFLPMLTLLMFFDAIQVGANQCLRGLKDVKVPMVLTGISYWLLGLPVAIWLGLYTNVGAKGVWWGLVVGLGFAAISLCARLSRVVLRDPNNVPEMTV